MNSLVEFLKKYNLSVNTTFKFTYTDPETKTMYEHQGNITNQGDLELIAIRWYDPVDDKFVWVHVEDLPNNSYYIRRVFPEISSFSIFEFVDRKDLFSF